MSIEAITWALKEPVSHSSAKFVLVVLANCANAENFEAYPSVKYIAESTCQDRKTVLTNLKRLIESGHISDTKKRVGHTGQVIIYRLNTGEKLNSTENGTVPFFPCNSPVFPVKESRFSVVTVPKTGHGTVNEPSIEPSINNKAKSNDLPKDDLKLPEWLKKSDWDEFVDFRKSLKKPMTGFAKRLMIQNLNQIAIENSPEIALGQMNTSMRTGWSDVYPPKAVAPSANTAYDRKMKTLNGLTGGILGSASDAVFKPLVQNNQSIDMEQSNANLLS